MERRGCLIVGGDGMIGGALFDECRKRGIDAVSTTRRFGLNDDDSVVLDLLVPQLYDCVPDVSVAYLCAGVVGYKHCEGNPAAWRTNVDGTIALGRRLVRQGAFVVFMSSDAVEHLPHSAYGLQKAAVEGFLQSVTEPAIVRAGRVDREMLPDLCDMLIAIGEERRVGVHNFTGGSNRLGG